MYLPALFAETDPAELHRILREHPLGMLVTYTDAGLEAEHLPFLFDAETRASGRLIAHVARANPVWQSVRDGDAVLVVFRGAQGYISPNWYPSKQDTHRHVPTWNYEVVHAHGRIHVHDDETYVRGVVARLTRQHEAGEPQPWKMGDAPADYLAEELAQIVGIEIEITRLEGKRKLGQNPEQRDFDGAVRALEAHGNIALASAMQRSRRWRTSMGKDSTSIAFKARLQRPAQPKNAAWTFLVLPAAASAKLPTRSMVTVEGTLGDHAFVATLEPDGNGSHWLKVDKALRDKAGAIAGDIVALQIAPVAKEPEPKVPADLKQALAANTGAKATWKDITAVAQRDWIHWISSGKKAETRVKRIDAAIDKLACGNRRACCFDRSGMYSKGGMGAPEAAVEKGSE